MPSPSTSSKFRHVSRSASKRKLSATERWLQVVQLIEDESEPSLTSIILKVLHDKFEEMLVDQKDKIFKQLTSEINRLKRELRDKSKDTLREVIREEVDDDAHSDEDERGKTRPQELRRGLAASSRTSSTTSTTVQLTQFDQKLDEVIDAIDRVTVPIMRDVKAAVNTVEKMSGSVNERVNSIFLRQVEFAGRLEELTKVVLIQTDTVQKRDKNLVDVLNKADDHFSNIARRLGGSLDTLGLPGSNESSQDTYVNSNAAQSRPPPSRPAHVGPQSQSVVAPRNSANILSTQQTSSSSSTRPQGGLLDEGGLATQPDNTQVSQASNLSRSLKAPSSTFTKSNNRSSIAQTPICSPTPSIQILPTPPAKSKKTRQPASSLTSFSTSETSSSRRSTRPIKNPVRLGSCGLLSDMPGIPRQSREASSSSASPQVRGTKRTAPDRPPQSNKRAKTVRGETVSDDDTSTEEIFEDKVVWPEMIPAPSDGEEMLLCDGCDRWFHAGCVGLNTAQVKGLQDAPWICPICALDDVSRRRSARSSGANGRAECRRPNCEKSADSYVIISVIGKRLSRANDDDPGNRYEYLVEWDGYPLKACEWRSQNLTLFDSETSKNMIKEFEKQARRESIDMGKEGDIKLLAVARDAGFDSDTGELRIHRTYMERRKKRSS